MLTIGTLSCMETYQDDSGQWWAKYPSSGRVRAEQRACEGCGATFIVPRGRATRFCGQSCGMRYVGSFRKPERGERHPNWRGGRHVRKRDGYVSIHTVDEETGERKWQLEHRLVMARHLGRELYDYETVHHKNGDKADNRPENLELWDGRHPKGRRATDAHCPTCTCFA